MKNKILMAAVLAAAASGAFAQQAPGPHQAAPDARVGQAPSPVTRDLYLQRSAQRFDNLDTNKDGNLSAEERHAKPHGRAEAPVTREQFQQRASLRFDMRDTNKDGKLTPDERHAGHPAPAQPGAQPAPKQ